jgi:hypothetical protein
MRLDDLVKVYEVAHYGAANGPQDKANMRAGIRAVVEALRDELRREWFLDDSGLESVERWMNEILASDGTHGSPELDADARKLEAMGQDAGPTVPDVFPEIMIALLFELGGRE